MQDKKIAYVITGLSASGKTVYGKKLATDLNLPFFDEDKEKGCTNYEYLQKMNLDSSFVISSSRYVVMEQFLKLKDVLDKYECKLILFSENRFNSLQNHALRCLEGNKKVAIIEIIYRPYDFEEYVKKDLFEKIINNENHLEKQKDMLNIFFDGEYNYISSSIYNLSLGYQKRLLNNYKEAIYFYEKGLNIIEKQEKPEFKRTLGIVLSTELGRCYISLGDKLKGLSYFEKAYKMEPNNSFTYGVLSSQLVKYYIFENNLQKAVQYISEKNIKIPPDEKIYFEEMKKFSPSSLEYKYAIKNILNGLLNLKNCWYKDEKEIAEKFFSNLE